MIKKKKINYCEILQDKIKQNNKILDIPLLGEKLIKQDLIIDKNIKSNYFERPNIIKKNNSKFKFDNLEPTTDNLFKTKIYQLLPDQKQQNILFNFFNAYTDMYNLTIKKIKTERINEIKINKNSNLKYCEMIYKPNITILKKEFSIEKQKLQKKYKINLHILDYAINDCLSMFKSIVSNQKNNHIKFAKMRYLKRNRPNRFIKIEKQICSNNSFCSSILGNKLNICPNLNYKNECEKVYIIKYDSKINKFYLFRRIKIEIKKSNLNNVISIDPGIRTLITGISENKIIEIGTNISSFLTKKIEKRNKIKNNKKSINKINLKIKNYVNDIQWKISNYLTKNYKTILFGSFSTNRLKKQNNSNLLEIMKILNMYKLRNKIQYKCLSRDKNYKKVNECYTTKCCVNCGKYNNIGSSKIFSCVKCKKEYDRDVKSAGCIYLKAIK